MANTKISALTALTNPTWNEELVYALNNANGKMTLDTMKTFANTGQQAALVSGVNIKTINNTSILWSGNIDVSWWGGWGGFEPTELWGDANIWELSEWAYTTVYDLYYKTGEKVPVYTVTNWTRKQMLFIVEESTGEKSFLVFNVWHRNTAIGSYASYWYSASSTVGRCYELRNYDWCLKHYSPVDPHWIDSLWSHDISQVITNITNSTNDLVISQSNPPYPWVTYTIYVSSVAQWETYTVWLWTWVTNPFWITLPSNSTKQCIITVLITSETTGIVTWCTIAS